jgi:hypothetical protein
VYYFFLAIVIISYETAATARWALLFIVRAFFNDTITVAVWTSFHVCASWGCYHTLALVMGLGIGSECRFLAGEHHAWHRDPKCSGVERCTVDVGFCPG